MATPQQKADVRPISFVLHNMAFGRPPDEVKLAIRPEDLTRTDTSRLTTTHTLGGAWADNFGPGIPTVQIAGHTGWGAGGRPDGLAEFQTLYKNIFQEWHSQRDEVLQAGLDPDLVRLIFLDGLDNFEWVVVPQNFVLKRNRSRPLLSQYQINLTWLSYDVAETKRLLQPDVSKDQQELLGLESLANSVEKAAAEIVKDIGKALGGLQKNFNKLVDLTARSLKAVIRIVKAGMGVVNALTNGLIGLATSLTRAAANIAGIVQQIVSLPMRIKASFMRLGSAFENAFCVLRNIFRARRFLPNYDEIYGASLCSSTAGGSAPSRFDKVGENPFPVLYPVKTSAVTVNATASAALQRTASVDAAQTKVSANTLSADMHAIVNGTTLQPSVTG